jgi:hypothetical protein
MAVEARRAARGPYASGLPEPPDPDQDDALPPMPVDIYPFVFTILMVAVIASVVELRASMRAPSCPRCVHCRHAAMERRNQQERDRRAIAKRLWGIDDTDDDDRTPSH